MSGNRIGGLKAAAKVKEQYGEDFYKQIGAKGGASGKTGGFASPLVDSEGLTGRERARKQGAIGGAKSRRQGIKNGDGKKPTSSKYWARKAEEALNKINHNQENHNV